MVDSQVSKLHMAKNKKLLMKSAFQLNDSIL